MPPSSTLDILFVHPGSRRTVYQALGERVSAVATPVWCLMTASVARDSGLRVAVLDCEAEDIDAEGAAERVEALAPRLVAIVVYGHQPSASAQNLAFAEQLRDAVKRRSSGRQVQLLMGGAVATLWPRLIMSESCSAATGVYAARGDGVWTAIALLRRLGSAAVRDVPGLVWRDSTGETCSNPPRDLDFVPALAYDLVAPEKYRAHNHHALTGPRAPYASIYASIGCPFRCDFCCIEAPFRDGAPAATPGRNPYILKPPDLVAREIDWLVEHWGALTIRFDDEMFGLNKRWLAELCDLLAARPYARDLNLWAYARVDQGLDAAALAKMRAAGFRWLCYGIESASDAVRDGVNKGGYDEDEITRVVRETESAGIEVLANYIFGLPDDDTASMARTLDLAMRLNTAFFNAYTCMPYPGSALYDRVLMESPLDLPESWLGYSQHSVETKPLPTKHLSAREVLAFRDEAHRRYFDRADYRAMLARKFGAGAVAIVDEMLSVPVKRRLLGDAA